MILEKLFEHPGGHTALSEVSQNLVHHYLLRLFSFVSCIRTVEARVRFSDLTTCRDQTHPSKGRCRLRISVALASARAGERGSLGGE